jgi:tripartite-type tricarboxylate transporter receptor subunit TctC
MAADGATPAPHVFANICRPSLGGSAMKLARRRFLHLAAGAAALPALSRFAWAQSYPSRPITMVVPYPAGGLFDALARVLAEPLREALSQTVMIENVGGAGGSIAVGRVARAAPDGYTLSIGSGDQFVVNPTIYPLQYDVMKDFDPIALLVSGPTLIVSKTAVPANNLKELLTWLKANHDKISQGHNGAGGAQHLCGLELQRAAGASWPFVPYRGAAIALQDVVGGRVDVMCPSPASSLAMVGGGLLRAYAVTGPSRMASAGYPDGGRGGIAGDAHFGLGRAVCAQGNAEERDRQAQCRGDDRIGGSRRAAAARKDRARGRAARAADAGSPRRAAESRNREVVADHQGGGYQGRVIADR